MHNDLPKANGKTINNSTLPKRKTKEQTDNNQLFCSTPIRNDSNVLTEMIPAKNAVGTNSCFINVVFRLLYHAKIFRNMILNYKHLKINLFIQIQELFKKYKELQMQSPSSVKGNNAIDVSLVRNELATLFEGYHKGYSGDPLDVFIHIMTALHSYQVHSHLAEDNSAICKPSCPAHSCFSLKLLEEISCSRCNKKTNTVYDNNYYVYEVYMWEIMNTVKGQPFKDFNAMLFNKINEVTSIFDNNIKFCKCPNQSTVSKAIILKENPHYLMIHFTWDCFSPPLVDLCNIYTMIPLIVNNNTLFKLSDKAIGTTYELKSVITFYNGHYTSCFKSMKENKWYFCDDMIIKEFHTWALLMQHMVKNHYHPIAVCYEIARTQNIKYEHITQKEYQELYSNCSNQDRSGENKDNESPFIVAKREDSSNSFMLMKRRSGIFNRHSNTNGDNSQDLIQDDVTQCTKCNKNASVSQLKCNFCGEQLTKRPSNNSNTNDNHWQESVNFNDIKNAVSIELNNNDIPIKNIKKIDLLRGGNCSGGKDLDSDLGIEIRQAETKKAMFDKDSSNEAEKMNDELEINIAKMPSKEYPLIFETARSYVLGNSPNKKGNENDKEVKPTPFQLNLIKPNDTKQKTNNINKPNEKNKTENKPVIQGNKKK